MHKGVRKKANGHYANFLFSIKSNISHYLYPFLSFPFIEFSFLLSLYPLHQIFIPYIPYIKHLFLSLNIFFFIELLMSRKTKQPEAVTDTNSEKRRKVSGENGMYLNVQYIICLKNINK